MKASPNFWSVIPCRGADLRPASHSYEISLLSHRLDGGSPVKCGICKLECLDRRRSVEHI
jgi:hypothetical protein